MAWNRDRGVCVFRAFLWGSGFGFFFVFFRRGLNGQLGNNRALIIIIGFGCPLCDLLLRSLRGI